MVERGQRGVQLKDGWPGKTAVAKKEAEVAVGHLLDNRETHGEHTAVTAPSIQLLLTTTPNHRPSLLYASKGYEAQTRCAVFKSAVAVG